MARTGLRRRGAARGRAAVRRDRRGVRGIQVPAVDALRGGAQLPGAGGGGGPIGARPGVRHRLLQPRVHAARCRGGPRRRHLRPGDRRRAGHRAARPVGRAVPGRGRVLPSRAARSTRSVCGQPGSASSSGSRCRCPRPASARTARTSGRTSSPNRRWRCCAAGPDRGRGSAPRAARAVSRPGAFRPSRDRGRAGGGMPSRTDATQGCARRTACTQQCEGTKA